MRPVISPTEAAALDEAARAAGTTEETLIARAGWAVARAVMDRMGGAYGRHALVVCGKGHNGDDGVVAAGHLARWGMGVTCLRLPGGDPARLARSLEHADVVVDAIFGSGFRGVPEGEWAAAIEMVAASPCPVVAVDIPSGVDGATGSVPGAAVTADLTVTFGAPKLGTVLMPGAARVGALRVVDIGLPPIERPLVGLIEAPDVDAAVPERDPGAHKKDSVVLAVAGSRAMPGAARLVAGAALRAGAGYVVVAAPASALPRATEGLPEAVGFPLPETEEGTIDEGAVEQVLARAAEGVHAIALGPGLSTHPSTQAFVRNLVARAPAPLVLDADGLNAFVGAPSGLSEHGHDLVLTPHPGEAARLGFDRANALDTARALAEAAGAVAVCKGPGSVIAAPDGRARIDPTGTAVLATAGTGDVLTGVIAGLAARRVDPFDAAWAGVYLHGSAGRIAATRTGEGSVAGDVSAAIPRAVAAVRGPS